MIAVGRLIIRFRCLVAVFATWGAICVNAAPRSTAPRLCFLGIPADRMFINYTPFFRALQDLGYEDGRTLAVHYFAAGDQPERFSSLAEECVRLRADVIVAAHTPAALAAKRATRTIPIVMLGLSDPVTTGLVASLARPGGNVTGLAIIEGEIAAKRLEILTELIHGLRRVLLLAYAPDPITAPQVQTLRAAARTFGITLVIHEIRTPNDFPVAFARGISERAGAALLTTSGFFTEQRRTIVQLAAARRMPLVGAGPIWAHDGALASYGTPYPDFVRGAASYVDRILRGTNPADLPVAQPTKFELAINRRTARALGLIVSPSLLVRADHVID